MPRSLKAAPQDRNAYNFSLQERNAQDNMALMYPYPYYWTIPEDNNTAYLPPTFPEHHHFFPHARHAFADATHNIFKDSIPAPKADVRETPDAYYVDVELPGVECREQIKLKWTNTRTLVLDAEKTSRGIEEGAWVGNGTKISRETVGVPLRDSIQETGSVPQNGNPKTEANGAPAQETSGEQEKPATTIHNVLKERDLGRVVRSFHFPVAVRLEDMSAKLHHGMLELTILKMEEEKVAAEHKDVHVEHDGN